MEIDDLLFELQIVTPSGLDPEIFGLALAVHASWGWQEEEDIANGENIFRVFLTNSDQAINLEAVLKSVFPEIKTSILKTKKVNWALAWKEFFIPLEIGDTFLILPEWLKERSAGTDLIPILIEPQMAFGTGHHATTRLCLQCVSKLYRENRVRAGETFLDLGTGSGILGIGCSKLGLTGTGLDIDPVAIENAMLNIDLNGVTGSFHVETGSIGSIEDGITFDLVMANILAKPLQEMALNLVGCVRPGGVLVLSGILREQLESVADSYMRCGLSTPQTVYDNEWGALIWS